jgi:putative nucleotidyltransferase with HDIG domain
VADSGSRIYLVGGYLRDILIHPDKPGFSKDFDFALAGGSGFALAREFASKFKGHFVPLDEKTDTARVVMDDRTVLDFAGCVGGDIRSDIKRRDFSINALFWDPEHPHQINDLVGGLADIKDKRVRALSQEAFIEDPLRMLRAFRFAATLSFDLTAETLDWIEQHRKLIERVAAERVSSELFAIFGATQSSFSVQQLADTGLFDIIFPELAKTRTVPKNPYHHLGLFDHSVETVIQTEKAIRSELATQAPHLNDELSFGVSRLAATKMASLLHDIGKPQTWIVTPEGKHTFIGHDSLGAEMVTELAERLHWARPVERFVSKLVKWHLRPGQLFQQKDSIPSEKAFYRFYRKAGSDVPELLLLALGDLGATKGPSMVGENGEKLRRSLIELFDGFAVFNLENERRDRLMTGRDVMRVLGIKAGPEVGRILAALDEAEGFKEITTRDEAERFILNLRGTEPGESPGETNV